MQMKSGFQTGLAGEVRIIPSWAFALATLGFIAAQIFFNWVLARQPDAPPVWARAALGLLLGFVVSTYVLFIGYVNGDARRRGMSRLLWTLVALLVPNGLGIILYFILRQPLHSVAASAGGGNCWPRCGFFFGPSGPQAHSLLDPADRFCRSCGAALRPEAAMAV